MPKLTDKKSQTEFDAIDKLTHAQMAELYRFSPSGHEYFIEGSLLYNHFMKRFMKFGGLTTEISKKIGW